MPLLPAWESRLAVVGLALFSATIWVSIFAAQVGYVLAAGAMAFAWLRRRWPFVATPLDGYLLAYVAAELISFLFSQDRAQNLVYLRRLLIPPMFYVAAHAIRSPRALAWTVVPFLIVADLLAMLGISRHLMGPADLAHRVRFWQHVLTTSDLLMMADLLALGVLLTVRGRTVRLAAITSVLLISACVVFTYSRSAWLGALAGSIVALACVRPRAIVWVGVLVAVLVALAPAPLRDRLSSTVDPKHPGNVERVNMWRAGLEIVRHHPWTGIGDIGTEKFYVRHAPNPPRERAGHLHSNVVQLAVTLGIPGLIVTLALFVRLLFLLLASARGPGGGGLGRAVRIGALASYVGFQVIGLFEWNFGDAEVAMTMWLLAGLSVAAQRME